MPLRMALGTPVTTLRSGGFVSKKITQKQTKLRFMAKMQFVTIWQALRWVVNFPLNRKYPKHSLIQKTSLQLHTGLTHVYKLMRSKQKFLFRGPFKSRLLMSLVMIDQYALFLSIQASNSLPINHNMGLHQFLNHLKLIVKCAPSGDLLAYVTFHGL